MEDKERKEWEHIALYNSAAADTYMHVLEIAPGELSEETRKWLKAQYALRTKQRQEAEERLKS